MCFENTQDNYRYVHVKVNSYACFSRECIVKAVIHLVSLLSLEVKVEQATEEQWKNW